MNLMISYSDILKAGVSALDKIYAIRGYHEYTANEPHISKVNMASLVEQYGKLPLDDAATAIDRYYFRYRPAASSNDTDVVRVPWKLLIMKLLKLH